ncbi:MAG: efflux RND transporter periplasmic adaptor subunit [Flavobacteriaceae bacterium]
MKRDLYKSLLFSLALVLLGGCGDTKNAATENKTSDPLIQVTQAQFTQGKMLLGSFEEKAFPKTIAANGTIDVPPENRAVVNASMGGYIKKTPLIIGHTVTKGQLLLTIENPAFIVLQQQYMEVNAQLAYLKAAYQRQTQMKAENISTQKSFLKAESEYQTAVARHISLDKQLRMLNISPKSVRQGNMSAIARIYAPIAGSITKVNVTKGSYVSPATEILEIIDNDHIHLELSVYEKDIMKVKEGQKIEFNIPEASSETYTATVHLIGSTIEQNRTVRVHGHPEVTSENNFLTGMFVEANIITESTIAKAIPNEAIIEIDDVAYVLILDKKDANNYFFKQIEVTIKESYKGYSTLESKNNFQPDTQFLTKGVFSLLGE